MKCWSISLIIWLICGHALAAEPPAIEARAYALLDFQSGQLLASSRISERMAPASLTKLMTAYLSFSAIRQGRLQWGQSVSVSEYAWRGGRFGCGNDQGSCLFLSPQKPAIVSDLVRGMIVSSGNDASIALAEAIAGSEQRFADLMNQQAVRLGMRNSHFVNATGLPDSRHYSSAGDIALLSAALIRDFPQEYRQIFAEKELTYNRIKQINRNRLLWLDPLVDGLKTGHTDEAGYCLSASALRDGMRLIAVVMGSSSNSLRFVEAQHLLNYGFMNYEQRLLYQAGQPVVQLRVWKGVENKVVLESPRDIYITLPKHTPFSEIKAYIVSSQPLIAPFAKGQKVAVLRVEVSRKLMLEQGLLARYEVPAADFMSRYWDGIQLFFRNLL